MAQDERPLYVLFDGETIGDTRYRLGDEVKRDELPGAVIQLLELQGRISATKPVVSVVVLGDTTKDVSDMSRAELEAATLSAAQASIRDASDDQLRTAIETHREKMADAAKEGAQGDETQGNPSDAMTGAGSGDSGTGSQGGGESGTSGDQGTSGGSGSGEGDGANASYADLRDKPLAQLRTAELGIVAQVEAVDISEATNNPDRVKLIQAARDAKAAQ